MEAFTDNFFNFFLYRSEMHKPKVSQRFGLMLEAYCRALGPYLKLIVKQVEAIDKLTNLTISLNERKDDTSKVSVNCVLPFYSKMYCPCFSVILLAISEKIVLGLVTCGTFNQRSTIPATSFVNLTNNGNSQKRTHPILYEKYNLKNKSTKMQCH